MTINLGGESLVGLVQF